MLSSSVVLRIVRWSFSCGLCLLLCLYISVCVSWILLNWFGFCGYVSLVASQFISFRECYSCYRFQPLDCIIFSFVKLL